MNVERKELRVAEHVRLSPREWENRAAQVRAALEVDEIPTAELVDVLREFTFTDELGASWYYDGQRWSTWLDGAWRDATPSGALRMNPFSLETVIVPPEPEVPAPVYLATHAVPMPGLPAWVEPDPGQQPAHTLDAGLDVMLLDIREDGWAKIECSNGWRAWVDGRLLERLQP